MTGILDDRNHKGEDSSICTGDNIQKKSAVGAYGEETRQSKWIKKKNSKPIFSTRLRFIPQQHEHLRWVN